MEGTPWRAFGILVLWLECQSGAPPSFDNDFLKEKLIMSPEQFKILKDAILDILQEDYEYSSAMFLSELLLAARKVCTPEQWKELVSITNLGKPSWSTL